MSQNEPLPVWRVTLCGNSWMQNERVVPKGTLDVPANDGSEAVKKALDLAYREPKKMGYCSSALPIPQYLGNQAVSPDYVPSFQELRN